MMSHNNYFSKYINYKEKIIGNLSGYPNIHPKTLQRAVKRRKSIKIDPINKC